MNRKIRWSIAAKLILGGTIALLLPRAGLIDGSTRIIPFFALLMAGVLPAMMQTVTVLKGDDLSPKEIEEYKGALRALFDFWSQIFAVALSAVGSLTLAVIFFAAPEIIDLPFDRYIQSRYIVDFFIFIFGLTSASLAMRFSRAFGGLKSLLTLNFSFAEKKGQKNAKDASKGLVTKQSEPSIRRLD